jgi:hypothetical protein
MRVTFDCDTDDFSVMIPTQNTTEPGKEIRRINWDH